MKQLVHGCMVLLFATTAISQTPPSFTKSAAADRTRAVSNYGRLPLSFEPNRGQTSSEAQWVARGSEYSLFLSGHDAVLELNSITPIKQITDKPKIDSAAVRMNLLGARLAERTNGEGQQAGTANYFTGNDPSKWEREVPNFAKVRLSGVYPGIDLVYYGRQGLLEYDFVVAPGADPSKIGLQFDGAKAGLAPNGDLVLPVNGSEKIIRFDRPTVYQTKDGARQPVAGAFHVASDGKVSFELGSYDRTLELVIDPTLVFEGEIATGNQQTIPQGIALDALGELVITGYTNDLTFPVTTGALQTNCQTYSAAAAANGFVRCGPSSSPSAFVTKISADGTSLVYSTYLHGGGGAETAGRVTVDALGDAYVLGDTSSNDFPVTSNAYQSLCQPSYSNPFSPMLPITAQCDNFYDGGGTEYTVNGPNLFIAKLNPAGTALLYSTFFGGSSAVYPEGIALDAAGNIYFASEVNGAQSPSNLYPNNTQTPFPTTANGYQTTGNNLQTPALSVLSADGQTLLYSTFLGSLGTSGHDSFNQAFALGQNGIAFLGGYTPTADFPTTAGSFKPTCTPNANNTSYCNTSMGFVAAIDTTKTGAASLVYASYLGGETGQGSNTPEQEVYGLAADANNDLFVTGYTYAPNFPTTTGAFQTTCINCSTAFLSKINPTGSALTWSTYVGGTTSGSTPSYGTAIAFDSKAQVYLYGFSQDGGSDFPQLDPLQPYTGGNKAFVTTFTPDGSTLLFGTRFGPATGGSGTSPIANGLAVDATGNMYIAGYTNDNGTFGTTPGTYSTPATNGFNRAFFAKFSALTPQTTTTLTIAPAAATSGQNITFTVAVAGVGQTTPVPTGTVALMNTAVTPSVTIGTITLDATGAGSFTTSNLPMGSYTIVAAYSGDSNYEYSQSAPQPLNVTTVLTSNLLQNPGAEFGTLQYWTIGGPGTPTVDTGTFDGGINPHTGGYDFLGHDSASDSLSQTVSIIQEGITAQQVDTGNVLAQISFWEQGLNQGSPSDDGSITLTFLDANSVALSTVTSATIDSHNLAWANGTGAYSIPTGTRSVTYTMNFMRNQGSDLDTFIDDNSLSLAVSNYTGLPVTTTTLSSTPSAPSVGQAVTFSVAVAGITQTTPEPTGTVTLMNTAVAPATTVGTITLGANGLGTFSTSALTAGNYSITAVYSGDANYAASTSATDSFAVSAPAAQPPITTATTLAMTSGGSAATTVASGSVVTLTATVLAGSAAVSPAQVVFCEAIALTCTGSHLLATVQVAATGAGAGTATYRFVPGIGQHSYLAMFLGTTTATGSASGAATLQVTGKSPTTTTIAQSGMPGNYTLVATTAGPGLHPSPVATQSVTINLGQSAQNYVLTGTGSSTYQGSTYGNYYNTQGACVTSGPITTCDLTGTFTSSTSTFAAGTYDFQTVFSGSVTNAILSQTNSPVGTNEPNGFDYSVFAPSLTMTLKLNVTGGGSYVIPAVINGNYAPSLDNINFADTSPVCGGTSLGSNPCQEDYVGTVAGATYTSPVTGLVEFEMPTPPPAGPSGPTGSIAFEDTSNANAVLGTATLGTATSQFALAQPTGSPVAVGGGAYGVATGDFNGDGFQDAVVENYSAGTVSVLLGKGDGTFQPQATYPVGFEPERVLVADLNGDGNLDLVVANTGSGTIGVLLGNGDGTFQAQVTYPCSSPVGLGVMDINHDGNPDVVAGDFYNNTISVLLGNGDGTLKPAVTYATGSTPQTVAEGDFNGDGNVDVAVGNEGGATVGIFLGNGDGTFQAMVTYGVGHLPMSVQVGDFNNDGRQDLAVSNQGDGTVSVLLGNGDGTFQTQATYPVGVQPVGLAIADFNGDGIPDITVGNTGQASLTQSVLLGNGDGTFQPQVTFPTGNFPYGVAVADFNGDGLPDMAVANFNDGTATIFLSQVTQTATATATVTIAGSSGVTHNVEASYPGDTNFSASASQTTALFGGTTTVASATTLAVTPAAPTVGQSVTFSVAVAGTTQLTPVPTGTVTLTNTAVTPNAVLGTITLGATGAGTFITLALPKGSYSVTAAYSGDTNYLASASVAQSFVVSLASQTITFPAIPNHAAVDAPFTLAATASSGLAVSYTVTSGPATVAGNTVTLTGAGTVTIQASQAGNADYAAATPVSQTFTVSGGSAPALATLSTVGAVAGAGATTITLTGTNFSTTDVAHAGTTALATVFLNTTTLTAVIPANLLANPGTLPVTVTDTATNQTSGAVNFVVAIAPVVVFSGPATATSDQQPVVTFQLKQPYAVPIDCLLTLTFVPSTSSGLVDPAVQFSTGGTTINFTVPAGSTTTPAVAFQTGTVAGTVTVTLTILTTDGVNVTPPTVQPVVVSLPPTVPLITAATASRVMSTATEDAGVLTVTMQGFSNTREVKTAVFHFTPVPGTTLTDPDVTVDVTDVFAAWFGSDASTPYGSTFTYTQPFNLNADPKTIQSVTVTLVNGVGSSIMQTTE